MNPVPPKSPPLSKEAVERQLGSAQAPPVRKRRGRFKPVHSDEKVAAIRRDRASGMKLLDVAAKHGVSGAYVSLLDNNRVRRLPEPDED